MWAAALSATSREDDEDPVRLATDASLCLGPRDRLDVDFLALLADSAAAARVVAAAPQALLVPIVLHATVESG